MFYWYSFTAINPISQYCAAISQLCYTEKMFNNLTYD